MTEEERDSMGIYGARITRVAYDGMGWDDRSDGSAVPTIDLTRVLEDVRLGEHHLFEVRSVPIGPFGSAKPTMAATKVLAIGTKDEILSAARRWEEETRREGRLVSGRRDLCEKLAQALRDFGIGAVVLEENRNGPCRPFVAACPDGDEHSLFFEHREINGVWHTCVAMEADRGDGRMEALHWRQPLQ